MSGKMGGKTYMNRLVDYELNLCFRSAIREGGHETAHALEEAIIDYILKYGPKRAVDYALEYRAILQKPEDKPDVPRETTEEGDKA